HTDYSFYLRKVIATGVTNYDRSAAVEGAGSWWLRRINVTTGHRPGWRSTNIRLVVFQGRQRDVGGLPGDAETCVSLFALHTYRQLLLISRCLSPSLLPNYTRCVPPRGHCNRHVERPKASPRPWLPRPRSSQPPPDQPPPPARSRREQHSRAWRRVPLAGGQVPPVPLASPPRLRPGPAYSKTP